MAHSIHTARWIAQIRNMGWDVHLFPSMDIGEIHPDLRQVSIYHSFYASPGKGNQSNHIHGIRVYSRFLATGIRFLLRKIFPTYRAWHLQRVIYRVQPDIIHSLETQHAGYLLAEVLRNMPTMRAPIVHSLWGSDLFYFGAQPEHKERIARVLSNTTLLLCEGQRDAALARAHGFQGTILTHLQATGGFDLQKLSALSSKTPPSQRKLILVKGYQGWAGQALTSIHALRECREILTGYTVILLHTEENSEVARAAHQLTQDTGVPTRCIPPNTPHNHILQLYGRARLSLAISKSDGVPNSLLESMAMGAFPIQSNTSCADEWTQDGVTAFLPSPFDTQAIRSSIEKALTSDTLVDNAARINYATIVQRLDLKNTSRQAIEMYHSLIEQSSHATYKNE